MASRLQRACKLLQEALAWQLQQSRGAKSVPNKIPVVLLQDIEGVGKVGETARVNAGYARHHLVPNKLASQRLAVEGQQGGDATDLGTSRAAAVDESLLDDKEKRDAAKKRRQFDSIINKLTTVPIVFKRKTNDGTKIDTPITAQDIADAVGKQLQIEIVPQLVDMGGQTLPGVGEYSIPLKLVLGEGQRAMLNVNILST